MTRPAALLALAALLAIPGLAQVPPMNAAGVTMGHHHLIVPDVAAQKKIWVDVLGGQVSGNPPIEFIKFPGAFLILTQGKGKGGTEGSAIDHFAFAVKDYNGTRDKLAAAGVKIVRDRAQAPREFVALFPDDVKVEFYEDKTLKTPLQHHHIHLVTTDPDALAAWYAKMFGAEVKEVKKEGRQTVAVLPGETIEFRKVDTPAAPTLGRALDHTGVDVEDVNEYCQKLAGMGLKCERPMGDKAPIAMVVDPAGTRIEINQGLDGR